MATALAVETYREELTTYLMESTANTDAPSDFPHGRAESDTTLASRPHESEGPQRTQLDRLRERLRDRTKQITALQGDVDPSTADELVRATQAIHTAITTDNQDALDRAETHLGNATPSA